MANLKDIFIKFRSANFGGVALIVGVMLFLILGILMMTVDLSRVQSGSSNNQAAIDAAVLGAAEYTARYRIKNNNVGFPGDIEEYTKKILEQNLIKDQSEASLSTQAGDFVVTVNDVGSVAVYACVNVKTGFAATTGNGGVRKVCNTSKASLPAASNIEIVFALDISKSMLERYPNSSGTQKLAALKDSMISLMGVYGGNPSMYWGVVPYTGMVDLGKMAPGIVADDLDSGDPSDELDPKTFAFASGTYDYHYKFDGIEDQVTDGIGSVFDDSFYKPTAFDYSLDALRRVPLTSRVGVSNPENPSNIIFDDAPPSAGMFQAYWHHPYDFFQEFDSNNPSETCGVCIPFTDNQQTMTIVATGQPFTATCYGPEYHRCEDPGADHTGCESGGVSGGGGPP